MVLVLFN